MIDRPISSVIIRIYVCIIKLCSFNKIIHSYNSISHTEYFV